MGTNEFKLEFYFNLYKDKPLKNRDEFRKNFKKAHVNFLYLPELIVRIEKYQIKKYGCTLPNDMFVKVRSKEECDRLKREEITRKKRRFR